MWHTLINWGGRIQRIQKHMASGKKGLSNWGGKINRVLTLYCHLLHFYIHLFFNDPTDSQLLLLYWTGGAREKLAQRFNLCFCGVTFVWGHRMSPLASLSPARSREQRRKVSPLWSNAPEANVLGQRLQKLDKAPENHPKFVQPTKNWKTTNLGDFLWHFWVFLRVDKFCIRLQDGSGGHEHISLKQMKMNRGPRHFMLRTHYWFPTPENVSHDILGFMEIIILGSGRSQFWLWLLTWDRLG